MTPLMKVAGPTSASVKSKPRLEIMRYESITCHSWDGAMPQPHANDPGQVHLAIYLPSCLSVRVFLPTLLVAV